MAFKSFSKDSISSSKEKKQQFLWIVLVVLILVVLIFLYFSLWRSPLDPLINIPFLRVPDSPSSALGVSVEKILKEIDFDANFLKNDSFLDLRNYGEWPLEIGQKGRANPFLP